MPKQEKAKGPSPGDSSFSDQVNRMLPDTKKAILPTFVEAQKCIDEFASSHDPDSLGSLQEHVEQIRVHATKALDLVKHLETNEVAKASR